MEGIIKLIKIENKRNKNTRIERRMWRHQQLKRFVEFKENHLMVFAH